MSKLNLTSIYEKGERIGVIRDIDKDAKILSFLGFGEVEGIYEVKATFEIAWQSFLDQLPVNSSKKFTEEEAKKIYEKHIPAGDYTFPRFRMDSGRIVWGFQGHHRPENSMKRILKDLEKEGVLILNVTAVEIPVDIVKEVVSE